MRIRTLNKYLFVIIGLVCILLLSFSLNSVNKAESEESFIELLLSEKDKQQRLIIFNKNKSLLTKEFVETFLKDTSKMSKSGEENIIRINIGMEMTDFLGNSYLNGLALYYKCNPSGNIDENLNYCDDAIDLFHKDGYLIGEGWCHWKKGLIYSVHSNSAYYKKDTFLSLKYGNKAIDEMEKARKIFYDLGMKENEAMCLKVMGHYCFDINNEKKGFEYFHKALNIYKKLNDQFGEAEIYYDLGLKYLDISYTKSHGYMKKSIEVMEKLLKKKDKNIISIIDIDSKPSLLYVYRDNNKMNILASYYSQLGEIEFSWGYFINALNYKRKTLAIYEQMEKEGIDCTRNKIGLYHFFEMTYMILGDITEELHYRNKALELQKEHLGSKPLEIARYYELSGICIRETDSKEAVNNFLYGLNILKNLEMTNEVKNVRENILWNLAYIYLDDGKFNDAKDCLEKIMEFCDKSEVKIDRYYSFLGEIYLAEGNIELAIKYKKKVRRDDFLFLSEAYKKLGKHEEAIKYARKALAQYKKENRPIDYGGYYNIGKSLESLGDTDNAIIAYKSSVDLIENCMFSLNINEYKRSFMENKIKIYYRLINLLLKKGKVEEAFDYNEKAKARAFLDMLGNKGINIYHNTDSHIIEQIDETERKIRICSKKEPSSGENIVNLKKEYEKLIKNLKETNPEYASLKCINPLKLDKIKNLLDSETILLEYFSGDENLLLWIITKNDVSSKIIPVGDNKLDELIRLYRKQIADDMTLEKLENTDWKETSKKLYNILFPDMDKYVKGKKRLVIVPHHLLHYLPFQTLITENGRYLMETYEISYLPSASVLSYCRKKNTGKKENLVAFAYGNNKHTLYSPLPGTIAEVEAIKKLYPVSKIYKNEEVTGDIIKKTCNNADLIHFATHGLLDSKSPIFSKIVLADKELFVYEIFNLHFKANLITLSACQTGLGELSEGNELIGFSRAFIYAGTPSVNVSLWNISDKTSAEFMEKFYYYLKYNSKSRALQLAQIDIVNKYPHPFFWAPFILIGDWK